METAVNTSTTLRTDELKARFEQQLAAKRSFIVGVTPTSNPDFMQLEIAQSCSVRPTDGSFVNVLLNWSDGQILRTWQNVEKTVLERMAPRVGEFLDGAFARVGLTGPFNLQLEEYTQESNSVAFYQNVVLPTQKDRTGAKPKINPTTQQVVTANGLPVYRQVSLVNGEEVTHITLKSDAASAAVTPSNTSNAISAALSAGRTMEA
jgi:hypothetical protein